MNESTKNRIVDKFHEDIIKLDCFANEMLYVTRDLGISTEDSIKFYEKIYRISNSLAAVKHRVEKLKGEK